MSLPIISGDWVDSHYSVFSDDGDVIVYYLSFQEVIDYSIKYTRSTLTWSDGGDSNPVYFNTSSSFVANTSLYNPEFVHGFRSNGSRVFEFENTHYVTPPNTNSVSNPSVSYVVADNELRIIIPSASVSTEIAGSGNGNRRTYYQLRKVSGTDFFEQIVHTQGWVTNHTIVPPSPGTYLLEKVRDNPLDYHSYNSVEVTQAQLDAWHTANNGHIFYDPSENYLHYFIHSSEDTTNLLFGSSGRELFYRVRSVNQSVHNFNHLHDYDTNGTYRPTAHGIYHLERVLTNPLEVLSYAYAEVTQSQLDAWNLLNAPPGDDSGNNAPPNTPRGRRGNHNFW